MTKTDKGHDAHEGVLASEAEARRWVEERLGRGIPEEIWRQLIEEGFVHSVLHPQASLSAEDLLEATRIRLLRVAGRTRRKPRSKLKKVPLKQLVPEAEFLRAHVFSEYLARAASDNIHVRRIRNQFFERRLLTPKQAKGLLESVAPRFCTIAFFKKMGIPLIGHRSQWYDPDLGDKQVIDWTLNTGIRIEWGKGESFHIKDGLKHDNDARNSNCKLEILGDHGTVLPRSVFDEIREVSVALARYYDWTERHATWFLLTGQTPNLLPIAIGQEGGWRDNHHHFRLTISVEPWLSPRAVLDIYRTVQRRIIGHQSRPLSEKNLMLFDFVSSRMMSGNEVPPWRSLMSEWNQEHHGRPEWQYQDVRIFARDFRRTGSVVVFPSYDLYGAKYEGKDE